ncbi:hypothetical protein TrVE_jg11669 [Triparma verrucosa]|uniref:Uncharacterized protein n=1 Tax=Triparma verrucosa TaxID=1606542 RepID=A0A9W6ZD67_9STRA|nr:hypothetical protein TrVE_jg11669 [Triparma verrucosa]
MSSPPRLSSISGSLRYALYSPNSPEFRSQIPSLKMYECVKKAKINPNSKDPITIGIINPPQDVEWFIKANKRYKGLKYKRERGEMMSDDWYMERFLEILNEQELKILKPKMKELPGYLERWYYRTRPSSLNLLPRRDYFWLESQLTLLCSSYPDCDPEVVQRAGGKKALKRLGMIESDYGYVDREKVLKCFETVKERIDNGNIGDDVRWMRMPEGIFEDWEGHGRRFQLDLDYDF